MENKNNKNNINEKFLKIVSVEEKSKNFEIFNLLKPFNIILLNRIINNLEDKIKTKCSNQYEKLMIYSKFPNNKENNDTKIGFIPIPGYIDEFKISENELKNCVEQFNYLKYEIENDMNSLNKLAIGSYNLCLNDCKDDMEQKILNEAVVRKCVIQCFRYLNYNKDAVNQILTEKLKDLKENISFI